MIHAKERLNDEQETLRNAIEGVQAKLWTALPAKILTVNYAKQTITAQPTIMGKITDDDGYISDINLPVLVDVPFQSFGGSGFVVTMPNLEGSECLIVFSSRCIDGWWSMGGVQPQAEQRMHDLSDGMAIIGFNSQARVIPNYSTTAVEVRTFDGTTKISLTSGAISITATHTIINGDLTVTGDVKGQGTSLHTHTHSGVQTGSGSTGAPN
jgi:hypothetical protein